MTLLKKLDPDWSPSEKPDLKVGETIEMTEVESLVRSGAAVIVDKDGIEQPLPGQKFACPICYKETETLAQFTAHVTNSHQKVQAPVATPAIEEVTEGESQTASEDSIEPIIPRLTKAERIQEKRLASLAKAREARKAKILAQE